MFLKQGRSAMKAIKSVIDSKEQWWHTPQSLRASYLLGFGHHTPHQGAQEKARRVRQMREHKCINPEVWTIDYSFLDTIEIVQEA